MVFHFSGLSSHTCADLSGLSSASPSYAQRSIRPLGTLKTPRSPFCEGRANGRCYGNTQTLLMRHNVQCKRRRRRLKDFSLWQHGPLVRSSVGICKEQLAPELQRSTSTQSYLHSRAKYPANPIPPPPSTLCPPPHPHPPSFLLQHRLMVQQHCDRVVWLRSYMYRWCLIQAYSVSAELRDRLVTELHVQVVLDSSLFCISWIERSSATTLREWLSSNRFLSVSLLS